MISDNSYMQSTVLYYPSSGWICLAPRQYPSHSDNDVTQYMQHGSLWPMTSSFSSIIVCIHPSILLLSRLLPSKLTTHRQSIPSADPCEAWLSSTNFATSAQTVELITVEEMWRMWWKRQTIGTLKETRCHLETIEVPLMEICI